MARPDFRAAAARRLSEERELPPAIVSLLSPETTHRSTGVKVIPVDRIESNPEQPVAHNELGIIYRKTGRFAQARKSYEAALAVYPGFHFARRNLAILCDLYLADLECALGNYEAYMKTVPSDEEASMWIADIRYRLDQ